ncbi:MAG: hypothetical protein F7C07_05045 [Desulfurococcales archaeon]|nr:hypothetical protein [Desulfurococcales archaeon]
MARRVSVSAPSHVHVGNVDLEGSLGRMFGTLGFTLSTPRFEVELVESGEASIKGYERRDLPTIFKQLSSVLSCRSQATVSREIPRGVGLGSTTAAILSLGSGLKTLCGRKVRLEEIALSMGRSSVSALGFYSFTQGGFVIDGGYRKDVQGKKVPPLLFRAPVPSSLVMVVALPYRPIKDVARLKEREREILESLRSPDPVVALKLSRITLMGIMPSIAEGDWAEAGRWITEFNRLAGEYWSDFQGGLYCCSEVEEVIASLQESGALLAGQSSWGPTAYGLVPRRKLEHVLARVRHTIERVGGGKVWVSRVDNFGARIEVEASG